MKQSPNPPGRGILVLGMHRSGTSLLTRLLEAAGFYVGVKEDLLPPQPDNPEGFWERTDTVHLNDWLLEVTDSRKTPWEPWTAWLQARSVRPEDLPGSEKITFNARAQRIRERLEAGGRPWVLKDPRLCLTFSCWNEVLGPCVPIFLHRNPLEIAASLKKRDGLPLDLSLAFWEIHLISALNATLGMPRLFLTMDELRSAPEEVLIKTQAFLQTQGIEAVRPAETIRMADLVKPHLFHHRTPKEERFRNCEKSQRDLIERLETGEVPDTPLSVPEHCVRLLSDFHRRMDQKAALHQQSAHLSESLLEAEDTLTFQQQVLQAREDLDREFSAILSERNLPKQGPLFQRAKHAIFLQTPAYRKSLTLRTARLDARDAGLRKCSSPPKTAPLRIAVILHLTDPVWLPEALKAYPEDVYPCLRVTCTDPAHQTEIKTLLRSCRPHSEPVCLSLSSAGQHTYRLSPGEVDALTEYSPDWILAHSANEFLSPPPRFDTVHDWLQRMDRLALPRVGFHEYEFTPCREVPEHDSASFRQTLRWYRSLGPAPRSGLAWRCMDGTLQPEPQDIPEHLRRYDAKVRPGILRRYLYLNPEQARAQSSPAAEGWPCSLPSCADLLYDDGHPEHLNPYHSGE